MDQFFKAALGVGGLATVGAAVFFGLYKQWLSLDIFSRLSGDQTFTIMVIFLMLVFLCTLVLIASRLFDKVQINKATASNNSVSTINITEKK